MEVKDKNPNKTKFSSVDKLVLQTGIASFFSPSFKLGLSQLLSFQTKVDCGDELNDELEKKKKIFFWMLGEILLTLDKMPMKNQQHVTNFFCL